MSLMQRLKKNMTDTMRCRARPKDSKRKVPSSGRPGSDTPTPTDRDSKNKKVTVRKRATTTDAKKSQRTKTKADKTQKDASTMTLKKRKSKKCQTIEEDPEPPLNLSDYVKLETPPKTVEKLPPSIDNDIGDKTMKTMKTVKIVEEKKEEKKEKPMKIWCGEEAAVKFVGRCSDITKLREEYNFLDSLSCNRPTEAFDLNTERNRPKGPKIYDYNRVVLNRPGQEGNNYINASLISVRDFAHKLIIAQLPRMENESFVEDFWHMIYQEHITLVYLLVPEVVLAKAPTKLFKEQKDEYQYIGKMFINTRKADEASDPKEYLIEVLPEGNSDSVMCQVHHHATWQHLQQPPKTQRIIKMIHQFLSEKEIQAANVCVVSEFGSGRACSFIGALIAIQQLNKGQEPNILEIMTNIKQQRPGATESFAQYISIYAVVLDYIRRKRTKKSDDFNKELTRLIEEFTDVTPPTSTIGN